jgi:hypothetical protein
MLCFPEEETIPLTDRKESGALSVYSPIHYQELPELFMDFICSLTGKSPKYNRSRI